MQLKNISLVVVAVVVATAFGAVNIAEQTLTASRRGSIDCYSGVACPIVWSPPKDRK
jgi:hypothetical protein